MTMPYRFWFLLFSAFVVFSSATPAALTQDRPRLIVLTDFFKDPDDKQSLIRLLCYANEFDIEGLIATSLAYGDGAVRPELITEVIDDYAAVFPSLRRHGRPGYEYPSPESLQRIVKAGAPVVRRFAGRNKGFEVPYPAGARDSRTCDPAEMWIGPGKDTAASEHIIHVVDRDDSRPVWIAVWGGPMDLAQALWKVREQRTPEMAAGFVRKLRVHQISWQDTGAVWIWNNVPELFLIQNTRIHGGMYSEGPSALGNGDWVRENLTQGHGRLGAGYPAANAHGKLAVNVKEGDSPSFLHLLAPGLTDPQRPEWGGWGGRFQRFDPQRQFFVEARDMHPTSSEPQREMQWTLGRWKEPLCNEFAARMDWCVNGREGANHPPVVHVEGDSTRNVLERTAVAGQLVALDATGTHDPDGDAVAFHWWQYIEPGTYRGPIDFTNADSSKVSLVAPTVMQPQTIHIVLAVTDAGQPKLTSYRRVVVTINPATAGGNRSRSPPGDARDGH